MKKLKNLWRKKSIKAHIDRIENGQKVFGWAIDPSRPERRIAVEVLVDGQPAGRGVADQYRYDLVQAFGGDGKWGFEIELDLAAVKMEKGQITLVDGEKGRPLSANTLFLTRPYKGRWFSKVWEEYLEAWIDRTEDPKRLRQIVRNKAYDNLFRFLKAQAGSGNFPARPEAWILLALMLAHENLLEAKALYLGMLTSVPPSSIPSLHRMVLDFASELWKYPPRDHSDPWAIRRIEIIQEVLNTCDDWKSVEPLGEESEKFDNLMAWMIRGGRVPNTDSALKLYYWLTGVDELPGQCRGRLHMAVKLWDAIHQTDSRLLDVVIDEVLSLQLRPGVASDKAIAVVIMEYLELMTNLGQIPAGLLSEIIAWLDPTLSRLLDDSWRIKARKMEWLYLIGERWKALQLFRFFVREGIDYLDWRSRYIPELLWLYFLDEGEQTDSQPLLNLLYKRQKEDRSSFVENIVLLADLLRWRENAGLGVVQSIVQRTIEGVYLERDRDKIDKAFSVIHRLTKGSFDDYFEKALELRDRIEGKQAASVPDRLHGATLFEDQNLYTLALADSSERACRRYEALLDSCPKVDEEDDNHCVRLILLYSERGTLATTRDYYKSLMGRLLDEDLYIVIFTQEASAAIALSIEDGRVTERRVGGELFSSREWGSVWLLDSTHLFHHNSLSLEKGGAVAVRDSSGEHWSFVLDRQSWIDYGLASKSSITGDDLRMVRAKIHEEITRFMERRFSILEAGILSFKNVEGDAIERLADFSSPLLEADEPLKAMNYLKELYQDPRITTIVSSNIDDTALIRIKEASKPLDENDLACFLVERNEFMRLEGFFDYYRERGVSRFYVIDNASDDGETLDFLLDQEDVELYTTPQAYSQSLYGVKWVEVLIKSKRINRWNLVLDADELLILDEAYPDLPALCKALEEKNIDALYTPFVDMYSDLPISETPYRPGLEILDQCGFYDRNFYTTYAVYGGIIGETPTYFGGVRSRAFGLDRVVLNKFPLFRYTPKLRMREGLHWIDHARFRTGIAVLLHFKYLETFHAYVEREIERGQHWNGASEYRKYHEFLAQNPHFSLYDPALSTPFESVRKFYENLPHAENLYQEGDS